ncbi:MAG: hypothetical protein AAF813_07780 [Pseudomonadota bacterium]
MTCALPEALAEYNARHDLELHTHASAEAQVAALSDDIAYNNHDLMDGLRAGLFTVEDMCALPLVGPAFADVDERHPGLEDGRRRYEALRQVFGVMVGDVLAESQCRLAEANPESATAVRHLGRPVIRFSDGMWAQLREIRTFLFANMYRHPRVAKMRVTSDKVVRALFALFMEDPRKLPEEWRDAVIGLPERARARAISDYIAGMTDRFALTEHARLCK